MIAIVALIVIISVLFYLLSVVGLAAAVQIIKRVKTDEWDNKAVTNGLFMLFCLNITLIIVFCQLMFITLKNF